MEPAADLLRAALGELVEVGRDSAALAAAIARVAVSCLDLSDAWVADTDSPTALPLAPGYWLEPGARAGDPVVASYAVAAGALLQQTIRLEAAAADHNTVLARLDHLHRDLDAAQRSEWVASERTRIAQDLHDRVAQTLFAVGLKSDWLLTHLDRDEHLRPDLERVKHLAVTGMREIREAIFSLSSGLVDTAQFQTAVQGLLKGLQGSGVAGDIRTWGDLQHMPGQVSEALYQVIREALVNVRRHSAATTVLVSVRAKADRVTVVIQDDGRGLPAGVLETYRDSGVHMGLRSMASRVARLGGALELAPGDECGLVVTLTVPFREGERIERPDTHSDRR